MPYLVIGILLVVVCTAAAVITVLQVGQREPVLALAKPVTVGQVLTAQDLRAVAVGADAGVDVIASDQASTVVGQKAAFTLPSGTLLSRAALGRPQVPPDGQAVVAVGVKAGQFPPALAPGTTVAVIAVPANVSSPQPPAAGPWTATVTDVQAQATDQTTVVSLQMPVGSARQVAAIPAGQLSLVAMPSGGQ